ncbi:hypothetical protein STEG23_037661, partial [Scotinomys teguina]
MDIITENHSWDHEESSHCGYICITTPASMAQRTSQNRGWKDVKSQNISKSSVKQSLLKMVDKQDWNYGSISGHANVEGRTFGAVARVDKEEQATSDCCHHYYISDLDLSQRLKTLNDLHEGFLVPNHKLQRIFTIGHFPISTFTIRTGMCLVTCEKDISWIKIKIVYLTSLWNPNVHPTMSLCLIEVKNRLWFRSQTCSYHILPDLRNGNTVLQIFRTAALRTESRMCRLSWFLDPGGWSKAAVVGLYFIFPGICTLSLDPGTKRAGTSGSRFLRLQSWSRPKGNRHRKHQWGRYFQAKLEEPPTT